MSNFAPKNFVLIVWYKLINNAIFKQLNIIILEPWGEIKNKFNTKKQIIIYILWKQITI